MKEVTKYEPLDLNANLHLRNEVMNEYERQCNASPDWKGRNPRILYFYCEYETAQKIASSGRLRVSSGMTQEELAKKKITYTGTFPSGLYATDIPPWQAYGVCNEQMRQAFYATTYGLTKSIDYFVAFSPRNGWEAVGSLMYPSTEAIAHWCFPSDNKGTEISIDGFAYGKSLIECLPFKYHWFG